jgi:hypothetical protein
LIERFKFQWIAILSASAPAGQLRVFVGPRAV